MKRLDKNALAVALTVFFALGLIGPVGALAASPTAVNLGTAGNFVVLSKTGISTTGSTSIVGNIGISPAAASYITGFALTLPAASAFSTSALVTGNIYAPGYADPTPANLTTGVLDMQTAYTDAAGRAPDVTELGAGNIGGLTLAPGVYKWGTGLTIPTDVTLAGGANDVWIFQVAQNLDLSSATKIILSGGAQASNVFWVVAGQTTLGTTSVFNGNILDQTTVVLNTGAQLNGRALAQAAVTLDSNTIVVPTSVTLAPAPTPVSVPTLVQTSTYTPIFTYTTPPNSAPTQTQTPPTISSTNTALQAQLNGLLASLHSLQAQASQQDSSAGTPASGQQIRTITLNLTAGSRNANVTILQQFLISQNKGSAAQALARVGASAYFGALTRAALAEFQASVGISPALGNFGAMTRAYVNAHY